MRRIDSHIHYSGDHADDLAVMEKLNVKFLCVCVAHDANDWLEQADTFSGLANAHPEAYAWCTSFDPVGFEAPDEFLVGYGLDYQEEYRNLPFIALMEEGVSGSRSPDK